MKSLSIQEQQIWDTLLNQSKAIIPGISPPKLITNHNLHDISAADYLLMLHKMKLNEDQTENNHVVINESGINIPENQITKLTC